MVVGATRGTESSLLELVRAATDTLATAVPEPIALPLLEGEVPVEISGTLLRNGPGRQSRGGIAYGHPFDGDGFVQRLVLRDGRASFAAQWVQTEEWRAEEAADRVLYRGFGTNRPGGLWTNALRMRFKNAANTSIIQHAGRTLALWEGGLPHEIDPHTLETVGRFDFDGALRNDKSWFDRVLNPELPFAAHPHLDPETGELVSFGAAYGVTSHLLLHRVSPDGVLNTQWIQLEGLPFVHDFVLTRRYAVFLLPAVSFDIPAALLGTATPVGSLKLQDAPGTLLVVPRDGGEPVSIEGPPGFVFHWAHGFEASDGNLVLDGMHYETFPRLDRVETEAEGTVPCPMRISIDLSARRATWAYRSDHRMELPTTATGFDAPTGTVWGATAPPDRSQPLMSGIGKLLPDGTFVHRECMPDLPAEPIPVCDGRWLVVSVWRPDDPSEVWIVDGDTLETVARLGMPRAYPLALHGSWHPDT